jgi:hypothetical protein
MTAPLSSSLLSLGLIFHTFFSSLFGHWIIVCFFLFVHNGHCVTYVFITKFYRGSLLITANFFVFAYPYPQKYLQAWGQLLNQHRAAGRICCSTSQYASPSMIIPKKDPTVLPRWVCDYRTLNSYTVRNRSPLPNLDKLVRLVATGKIFSILNQTNAFFQTRMREEDIPLTAVKTPWGLMEWCVMPMGLTNAPATHQARLEEALGELINVVCVVYLDKIVVFSQSAADHKIHVCRVLNRLQAAKLYCSPKKTKLFRPEVKFLGHYISGDGIRSDNKKVAQVQDWLIPKSPRDVKKFLGTVQWMKKFIWGLQKYVGTLMPLTSTKLDPKKFKWGEAEEKSLQQHQTDYDFPPLPEKCGL